MHGRTRPWLDSAVTVFKAAFSPDSRGIATRGHFFSTSFQNSAAGLPLIVSSVLMERRISPSRSGWKSHSIFDP